jgi:hypothetical protein
MALYMGYWWAVPVLIAASARWKQLSLALIRVLAVFGTERVRRDAREVLRLDHPDAAHIPSCLAADETSPPVPAVEANATKPAEIGPQPGGLRRPASKARASSGTAS